MERTRVAAVVTAAMALPVIAGPAEARHEATSHALASSIVPPALGWSALVPMGIVALLGGVSLGGFFATKAPGFGRYNTSILAIILALTFGSIALLAGLVGEQAFSNLLLAVVGFAGGMVVGKERP